ncbi:hypothetical protein TrST_g170 [Triparma strigata]|uniref:Major facilitator superfamily (MFS) profile domain-containing protein n=1 Tax=Triparma strigata TaxID=1606541 RepID=A0A9W7BS90_9STRA|nr:hypothetical protein TrST_g170 [Triparma strigata]
MGRLTESRYYAAAVYAGSTIFLFADQNLLSPNLSIVAEEFGFDDEERDRKLGGYVALAFFTLGCPISFLVGYLADRHRRIPLFALIIVLGEGACFFTYFTTTYTGLLVTRALTGISVGGALPLIFSLLSDMFGSEHRQLVSALVGGGMGFGIAFGQMLAGFVGPAYGWRLPFVIVSIPAFICALLMLTTLTEPARGGQEAAVKEMGGDGGGGGEQSSSSSGNGEWVERENGQVPSARKTTVVDVYKPSEDGWETFKSLLRNKTAMLLFLQGLPGCLPWGLVYVFLNDYLSNDRGLSIESATLVITLFGVGCFGGLVVGGAYGQYLQGKSSKKPVVLMAVTEIIGCFPLFYLLNNVGEGSSYGVACFFSMLSGFMASITGPNVRAVLQNVTLPEQRGAAFALLNTTDDIGKGAGPFVIALMVTAFKDRQIAFNVVILGWLLGGIVNGMIYFTVEKDEADCQEIVRKTFAQSIQMAELDERKSEQLSLIGVRKGSGKVSDNVVV